MNRPGIRIQRYFTIEGVNPYDSIKWELRTATIVNSKGETIFEQKDVRVPSSWSQTATNIVVSKYFYGKLGTPERETGVDMLIRRVVDAIVASGVKQEYFDVATKSADVFHDELSYILLNQLAAFNSPVWFNVGCDEYGTVGNDYKANSWHWVENGTTFPERSDVRYEATGYRNPQCSACFINSIEDTMEGIMHLATTEAMLFKFGSGTGTNFSALRSSKEGVSGGGMASGPLSFMKGLDAFAGVIKSGGKTRRAAKMAILNADHPDIEEFIDCKVVEDRKAQALMREGYDGTSGPDSPAYSSIFYQNANNSVRVSDEFMKLADDRFASGGNWDLKAIKDGKVIGKVNAGGLLRKIAQATWECGDPGIQFDDVINKWHTCKATARINSSNPCSEYMFLDDTACNLASLNLMKFVTSIGVFDHYKFCSAVNIMIIAQDILVDLAGYPTEKIAINSHDYRPLGLGYANLGALLMSMGLPYDSDAGRLYAGVITAIMTGQAYLASAGLAAHLKPLQTAGNLPVRLATSIDSGSFPGYDHNADSFIGVMELHSTAAYELRERCLKSKHEELITLSAAATEVWDLVTATDKPIGFRNSQVTVLAPTGTIGFMMDCDTTGIEPELSLIKFKKMVGGGQMKIVNQTVPAALKKLGYSANEIESILEFIDTECTPEGSGIKTEHLDVFDTAFRPMNSTRSIAYQGHIKMMAAAQPFLSGAISKTVNVPTEATPEEIEKAYVLGWKLGLKAIAIYRDGSKANQVLVSKVDAPVTGVVSNDTIQHMLEHREQEPPSKELLDILSEQFGPYLVPDGPIDDPEAPPKAVRHKLPDTRPALTHKFSIVGHDGYIIVGLYPNGQPGEIFITMAKEGSTISGFMDCFALVFSIALQHGVPLEVLVSKLANTRFEPSGWTGDPNIGYAKSIMDYLARWLKSEYLVPRASALFPTESKTVKPESDPKSLSDMFEDSDAPACPDCGSITVRNGSCYKCIECGSTTGCS